MFELEAGGSGVIALPPDELVDGFKQLLGDSSQSVDDLVTTLTPVPSHKFGGSASGATLGYYANRAHQKVTEELSAMVIGLLGLKKALADYQAGVKDADLEAKRALEALATFVDPTSLAAIAGDLGVKPPTHSPAHPGTGRVRAV